MTPDTTTGVGPDTSSLAERTRRFNPPAEYVKTVFMDCWTMGEIAWVLGDEVADLASWVASETTTHYHLHPPTGEPGVAIRRETYGEFYVACMHARRAMSPWWDSPRELALEITPESLVDRIDTLLGDALWSEATEKGTLLFHTFFVRAAEDPCLADRFHKLFDEYVELTGTSAFFFSVVDGIRWHFLVAWLLDRARIFIKEGRQHAPATKTRNRFRGAVNLILAGDAPFSAVLKASLREEWKGLCRRADDASLRVRFEARKAASERDLGGKFFGQSPKGELQARPYFTRETVHLMDVLISKGMTKGAASRLVADTLSLVCAEWYKDADPENVIKRYDYHQRKRAANSSTERHSGA